MTTRRESIDDILARGTQIDRAAREGVRQALLRHKRLGESIVVWRDGRVVEVPAEEIEIPPEEFEPDGSTPNRPPEMPDGKEEP